MDTSSYALGLLLGKFGLGQADPSHWEFVSCVDAGLEEGKLQFFWYYFFPLYRLISLYYRINRLMHSLLSRCSSFQGKHE